MDAAAAGFPAKTAGSGDIVMLIVSDSVTHAWVENKINSTEPAIVSSELNW